MNFVQLNRSNLRAALIIVMLCVSFTAASSTAKADALSYLVNVNTSSLVSASGYLDFQFDPGAAGAQAATASITNYASTGMLSAAPTTVGAVSGVLPGAITIGNSTAFNDYFHAFTYGNGIAFTLTLDGPAVNTPNQNLIGSDFTFYLYAADGSTPFLTADPNGELFRVALDSSGAATIINNGTPPGVVTITPQTAPVPEPATMMLMGTGLAGIWAARRRHANPTRVMK